MVCVIMRERNGNGMEVSKEKVEAKVAAWKLDRKYRKIRTWKQHKILYLLMTHAPTTSPISRISSVGRAHDS